MFVTRNDLVTWLSHLSLLLHQHTSVWQVLRSLAQDPAFGPRIRVITEELIQDLAEGMTLWQAMSKHPKVFPPLVIGAVALGERGGRLDEAVRILAEHAQKGYPLRFADWLSTDERELVVWLRLLALAIEAKLPALQAFDLLAQACSYRLRLWTMNVRMALREGESLADVVARWSPFPSRHVLANMLRRAETVGQVPHALREFAIELERGLKRRLLWQALMLWLTFPLRMLAWLSFSFLMSIRMPIRSLPLPTLRFEVTKAATEKDLADEAPIIRIANVIFREAIRTEANAVLIQQQRKDVRVRFEIDGILHEIMRLPKFAAPPLVRRLKLLGDLDLFDSRFQQLGRFTLSSGKRVYETRVATFPSEHGEGARLKLWREDEAMSLEQTGMTDEQIETCRHLMGSQRGLIIVAAPPGEGITTTQIALLKALPPAERDITLITLPADGNFPGATRLAMNGASPPQLIESAAAAHPDVLLIGEASDKEVWERAAELALSSLIIAGLKMKTDAAGVIEHLLRLGLSRTLLFSALLAIVTQRLMRMLCENCRRQTVLTKAQQQALSLSEDVTVFEPGGCTQCRQTGYRGRTGVFEVLEVTPPLQEFILQSEPLAFRRDFKAMPLVTLRHRCTELVRHGITSASEALAALRSG